MGRMNPDGRFAGGFQRNLLWGAEVVLGDVDREPEVLWRNDPPQVE